MTSLLRRHICLISILIKAALIVKTLTILFKSHYTIISVILNTINQSDLFDLKLFLLLVLSRVMLSDHCLGALCFLGLKLLLHILVVVVFIGVVLYSRCLLCSSRGFRGLAVSDCAGVCRIDATPTRQGWRCLWLWGGGLLRLLVFVCARRAWRLTLDHKLLWHSIICISCCAIISSTLFLFADFVIILEKFRLSILTWSCGLYRRIQNWILRSRGVFLVLLLLFVYRLLHARAHFGDNLLKILALRTSFQV